MPPLRGTSRTIWVNTSMLASYTALLTVVLVAPLADADVPADVFKAEPLVWEGDLSVRMMDGLHLFVERKIDEAIKPLPHYWLLLFDTDSDYAASIEPNRKRFAHMIGAVDPFVSSDSPRMERFG